MGSLVHVANVQSFFRSVCSDNSCAAGLVVSCIPLGSAVGRPLNSDFNMKYWNAALAAGRRHHDIYLEALTLKNLGIMNMFCNRSAMPVCLELLLLRCQLQLSTADNYLPPTCLPSSAHFQEAWNHEHVLSQVCNAILS